MAHTKRKQVALYLTEEQNQKVEHYAKKYDLSKQRVLSNLIDSSLDDLAVLERFGVMAIGVGIRDLIYKLQGKGTPPGEVDQDS